MTGGNRRWQSDITKLMMSDFNVEEVDGDGKKFHVKFHGPKNSPYEGGVWKILVFLPENYPFVSPRIEFVNKVFHPNVDEISGVVCLNVLDESWSPLFDLKNVFEVFLPQLLLDPNPSDPSNGDAALLMIRDRNDFDRKVREYVELYAKEVKEGASDNNDDGEEVDEIDEQGYGSNDKE